MHRRSRWDLLVFLTILNILGPAFRTRRSLCHLRRWLRGGGSTPRSPGEVCHGNHWTELLHTRTGKTHFYFLRVELLLLRSSSPYLFFSHQTIEVIIDMVANHGGFFQFNLCVNNNPEADPDQACFREYPLRFSDGELQHHTILDHRHDEQSRIYLEVILMIRKRKKIYYYTTDNVLAFCRLSFLPA